MTLTRPGKPLPPGVHARHALCEFGQLGAMVAARCPYGLNLVMRQTGALWEPGSRRWLIERRRINPVTRTLWRVTDPQFRRAGMSLYDG